MEGIPLMEPQEPKRRSTGFFQRIKLILGGESDLEREHRTKFSKAKEMLQRQLKAGKISEAEFEKQFQLLQQNGHHKGHAPA